MFTTDALEVSAWKTRELEEYVGGLSKPSKMPGWAYSLPAKKCKTGSKLRAVQGSTCSGCYAMKGRYVFPNVQAALYRRLDSIERPLWAYAMAELISRRTSAESPYFRWHDSGDIQSVDHFRAIVLVCELTPQVRHWIPTREYRFVTDFVAAGGEIPANLNVRMSAHMLGGIAPTFPRLSGLVTLSTVSRTDDTYPEAHACPARFQGNSCGDCRACWDRGTPHVDYHAH